MGKSIQHGTIAIQYNLRVIYRQIILSYCGLALLRIPTRVCANEYTERDINLLAGGRKVSMFI